MTLEMEGEIIDWVYLNFNLTQVTQTSGTLAFTNIVNTTWMKENFSNNFYSYVTNG